MCRIIDSKSSLIPICLILTSGASLRASLGSVREKIGCLRRGVPRDSLSLVPVSFAIIDDDVAAVAAGAVARSATVRARKQIHPLKIYIVIAAPCPDPTDRYCDSETLEAEVTAVSTLTTPFLSRFRFLPFLLLFGGDSDQRAIDMDVRPAECQNFQLMLTEFP